MRRWFDHGSKQGTRLDCTSTRSKGCTVLLGARDLTRGTEATETLKELGDVRAIEIDYAPSRSHAAKTIEAEFGRLDILVNNAGIADSADGLPSQTDVAAVERILPTLLARCESHKQCCRSSRSQPAVAL